MSTSHALAYADAGMPGERYQLDHVEKAKGGIGLTMFGGSASVAPDSSAEAFGQISVNKDRVVPYFQEFSRRVHDEGAALMCQITHMGKRNRWDTAGWRPLVAPTQMREPAHRAFTKEIEDFDLDRIVEVFGAAAAHAAAEQGHDVVLYEKTDQLGGQVNLASRAVWRENLSGIIRWRAQQIRKKNVDLRLGVTATPEAIEADEPDLVIVATGGRPN